MEKSVGKRLKQIRSGNSLNSIPFSGLYTIKESGKTVYVFTTNKQSSFTSVFLMDSWDFRTRLEKNDRMSLHVCSSGSHMRVDIEGHRRAPCQLEKALQGSETKTMELLGGTEENSVSPMRGH